MTKEHHTTLHGVRNIKGNYDRAYIAILDANCKVEVVEVIPYHSFHHFHERS